MRCLLCDHNGELHWRTIILRVMFTEQEGKPVVVQSDDGSVYLANAYAFLQRRMPELIADAYGTTARPSRPRIAWRRSGAGAPRTCRARC